MPFLSYYAHIFIGNLRDWEVGHLPKIQVTDERIVGAWPPVISLTFSVVCIVTAEFLPVSILTPMAEGLGITEGIAGQTIAITAFTAIFVSIFLTTITRGIDRRVILMGCTGFLAISNVIVVVANNFGVLLAGRVLLGLALGAFWSMAPSVAMRLVPEKDVPKALSIIFGGVSIAMVAAAPIGSYLGDLIGWRGVFGVAALLGFACLIWQARTLPMLPAREQGSPGAVFRVLARTGVPIAMLAILAVFTGNMALFAYIRPFLEQVSGFNAGAVSFVLLLYCVANLLGALLSSFAVQASLKSTLTLAPVFMGLCAAAFVWFGTSQFATAIIMTVWGFSRGMVPVAWSTWVTRHLGDDAENAGGLQVATIQLANTAGAGVGGLVYDTAGTNGPVIISGLLFALTAIFVTLGMPGQSARGEF